MLPDGLLLSGKELLGQHAELAFEALGEVFRRIEAHGLGEFVDADVGLLAQHAASLLQADAVDESRDVLSGEGAQFVVEGG